MDDDIDYAELFGVTPEEGDSSDVPGAERPGQEDLSPQAPEDRPEAPLPQGSETQDQPPAPEDGTEQTQEGAEGAEQQAQDRHSASPNDRSGSLTDTQDRHSASPNDRPGSLTAAQVRAQYEAAAAQAQAEAQRAVDEAFALSGLRNPYTGQPITSKAEYDAYKERFDAERREQLLKKSGMSGEEFQQFVQDLPEVRKAREAQEAAEKAVRETREAAARVEIEKQVREIGRLDPSIKKLEDLAKMPTYPRFYELVKRGNTLTDAFRLANFDALTQSAAAGARQSAVNAARSKEHLEPTRSRGQGGISVPAEVKAQYRLFNPDATDEEIQRHYAKSHKEE